MHTNYLLSSAKSYFRPGRSVRPVLAGIILVALFIELSGCSGSRVIQSQPVSGDVDINGDLADWAGQMLDVKNHPARFGTRHDGEYAYIAFSTTDEGLLRQIISGGLTVWFNNTSDKSKQFGIRYPTGRSPGSGQGDRAGRPVEGSRPAFLSEFEIVNEEGSALRMPVDAVPGIELDAYLEFGSFTYELRVPLHKTDSFDYAIDISDAGTFGLGLVTGSVNASQVGRAPSGGGGGRGGGGRGGGRRGGGGRGGGGGGRGGGGGGAAGFAPLDFWVSVTTVPVSQ